MKTIVLLFSFLLVMNCSATRTTGLPATKTEKASLMLEDLVNADEPGIQYIVVNSNRVLFEKNVGLANV